MRGGLAVPTGRVATTGMWKKGRCRLGFLPSEGSPEGPKQRSSSWFVGGRVGVWACLGVGRGVVGGGAIVNLSSY